MQTAKVGPETGRRDGSKGLRGRRREVREALKEHVPPRFVKVGCSTPIRSPESGKPIKGSVSVWVRDSLGDAQPGEVMGEMGKPGLVV